MITRDITGVLPTIIAWGRTVVAEMRSSPTLSRRRKRKLRLLPPWQHRRW